MSVHALVAPMPILTCHWSLRETDWAATVRCTLAVLLLLSTPIGVAGQVVRGLVLDDASEQRLPTVDVSLLSEEGEVLRTTTSDPEGRFMLGTEDPGIYRLEAQRLGYESVTTPLLEMPADTVLDLVIRMAADAIPLDPLEVVGRGVSEVNRATFEGLYQRRARAGNLDMIFVQGDEELDQAMSVRRFIQLHGRGLGAPGPVAQPGEAPTRQHGCVPPLLIRGTLVPPWRRAAIYDMRLDELEGIEMYRRASEMPLDLRPHGAAGGGRCGAVVIWPRRMGDEPW